MDGVSTTAAFSADSESDSSSKSDGSSSSSTSSSSSDSEADDDDDNGNEPTTNGVVDAVITTNDVMEPIIAETVLC